MYSQHLISWIDQKKIFVLFVQNKNKNVKRIGKYLNFYFLRCLTFSRQYKHIFEQLALQISYLQMYI